MTLRPSSSSSSKENLTRKLDKFKVARTDTKNLRHRKPKKCSKKSDRYNYPLSFAKSEAIFNKWLRDNKHRLKHQLIPSKYNNYHFEGVIKEVELLIHNSNYPEAEIAFSYYGDDILYEDSRCFDLAPIDYILQEAYHPQKGYFDMDRVDGDYTYFPTREELYNEVFEGIINYSNEKLIPENSLYMFDLNGVSWAYIDYSDESNPKNRKVTKDLKTEKVVDDLSQEERYKLLEEEKAYRVFKYDLFDSTKKPEVRYFWNKN